MWKRAFSASFGVYTSSYQWMSLFAVGAFLIGVIGGIVFSSLADEIIPLGSILGVVVLFICAVMSTLSLFGFGTSFLVQLGTSRRVAISVLYVRALIEWSAVAVGFVVMSGLEVLALRLFLPQMESVWLVQFIPVWVYPLVVGAMVIFFGFFGALMMRYGRGAYAVLYAVIVLPCLLSGPVIDVIANRTDTNFFTHAVLTAADFCARMPAVGWSVLGVVAVVILIVWSIALLKRTGV